MDDPAIQQGHSQSVSNVRDALQGRCRPIASSELLGHADELKGKVVLVTGAGSGFGAEYAKLAASLGARVVLGDIQTDKIESLAHEARTFGEGDLDEAMVVGPKTNVTSWEEQRALFDFADKNFGRIDVVVASAGVTEAPGFDMDRYDDNGDLQAPNLRTLDINLIGSLYTYKLAAHYMRKRKVRGHIVLMGSLASFFGLPLGPIYGTGKHAILGLIRSQHYIASSEGISVSMVAPWFTDTPIVEAPARLMLAGLPFANIRDVVQAMVYASTSDKVAGAALPVDPKGVLLLPHFASDLDSSEKGFLHVFSNRAVFLVSTVVTIRDCLAVIFNSISPVSMSFLAVVSAAAAYALFFRS